MTIIFIILATIFLITTICLYNKVDKLQKEKIPLLSKNFAQELENKEIEKQKQLLQNEVDTLNSQHKALIHSIQNKEKEIEEKTKTFESLQRTIAEATRNQTKLIIQEANREYEKHTENLETAYQDLLEDLMGYSKEVFLQIEESKATLATYEQKQKAYIQEQQHKEKMLREKDYYRLAISENDKRDIKLLREIQASFSKKETIDKVIWENYFKPAYDVLMPHIFADTKPVCGIYKITCLINDKAYIGQSVDIRTRFREHTKAAISAGNNNKLYSEMRSQGLENFLFEILETVPRTQLNERELYWINFYGTKDYGLNTVKGNEK